LSFLHKTLEGHLRGIDAVDTFVYTRFMTTTIRKWGNSYAIRLPKAMVEGANLREGQSVEISSGSKNSLNIVGTTPVDFSLKQLVARITPANRHAPEEWGTAVGKEAW